MHALLAIEITTQAHIFAVDDDLWLISGDCVVNMGTDFDMDRMVKWKVVPLNNLKETKNLDADIVSIKDTITGNKPLDPIEVGKLCQDQHHAYDIII